MGTKTTRQSGGTEHVAKDRKNIAPADHVGGKMAPASKAGGKPKAGITVRGGTDPAYLALIRRFPLRPIRSDAELDAASEVVDDLTGRDDLSPAESDYLDVLGDLVEKYEDEHVEMPHVSDAAMLRSLMDEMGVKQVDIVRGTGISKTVLSLVLNGKRDLTREHIGVLSRYFGVNPSSFLGPV
ncbi:MAG: higA [Planctomycetota bacterium]|nr:higA [Planctomycetota bacterium]